MAPLHPDRLFAGFVVCAALVLSACGDEGSNDRPSGVDFDYIPPTSAQLQEVQTLWASRDLTAKNVLVFYREDARTSVP
jgi:hypothetical protein